MLPLSSRARTGRSGSPPADEDQAIANILADLGDQAADRAWLLWPGPLVDADGYDAARGADGRQWSRSPCYHDRFSPGDLSGIVALADIFLRSGPGRKCLCEPSRRPGGREHPVGGPDRATLVLDLVDLLVRAACPDEEARLRLALALLRPLRAQDGRLEPEQARFARQLSGELQVLAWSGRMPRMTLSQDNSLPDIPAMQVLLYSLDERVLERTKTLLGGSCPMPTCD